MTTYAPDIAPELEPKVVHWQPTHPAGHARAHLLTRQGAALAMALLGALALGVAAAGVLTGGRSGRGRRRLRLLQLRRRPF